MGRFGLTPEPPRQSPSRGKCATMSEIRTAAEKYWVIYYLIYLGLSGGGLWYYWPRLLSYWRQPPAQDDSVYLLAAIFGTAMGIALGVAIILEVSGRMVLLIPAAVRKIKEQGRKEGIEEGKARGRKSERRRIADGLAQLGVREGSGDEVMLSRAEVLKILRGDDGEDA